MPHPEASLELMRSAHIAADQCAVRASRGRNCMLMNPHHPGSDPRTCSICLFPVVACPVQCHTAYSRTAEKMPQSNASRPTGFPVVVKEDFSQGREYNCLHYWYLCGGQVVGLADMMRRDLIHPMPASPEPTHDVMVVSRSAGGFLSSSELHATKWIN